MQGNPFDLPWFYPADAAKRAKKFPLPEIRQRETVA